MGKNKKMRANEQIDCSEVRLVDQESSQHGIVTLEHALQKAQEVGLDLVEVSPNASPPVCRIMDYGKLVYHKRKQVTGKKHRVTLKEIKFRPNTDIGDFNIKLRKITVFITAGNRVKVSVIFRGREMQHKDLGMNILDRVKQALHEVADIDQEPQQEGRQLHMLLSPRKS